MADVYSYTYVQFIDRGRKPGKKSAGDCRRPSDLSCFKES